MTRTGTRMRLLLVGPLPPPIGGASVSFKEFVDWARECPSAEVAALVDLSPTDLDPKRRGPFEDVRRVAGVIWKTLMLVTSADVVLLFASNNFLLMVGPFILLIARLARRPCYMRPFGGFLDGRLDALNRLPRALSLWWLARLDGLIVETKTLCSRLMPYLGASVYYVPGYRRLPDQPTVRGSVEDEPDGALRLVFLSQITEQKGVFDLLDAVREINERGLLVKCHFFGPVRASISESFDDAVHRTPGAVYGGAVAPPAVMNTLLQFDALVLPTRHAEEGHPGVLIEAMLAGIPVIASRMRSIVELIDEGRNGLLVEPANVTDLACAIRRLRDHPDLLEKMAEESSLAGAQYSADAVLPQLMNIVTGSKAR